MQLLAQKATPLQHRSQDDNLFFYFTHALLGNPNFSRLILIVAWREQDHGTGTPTRQLRFSAVRSSLWHQNGAIVIQVCDEISQRLDSKRKIESPLLQNARSQENPGTRRGAGHRVRIPPHRAVYSRLTNKVLTIMEISCSATGGPVSSFRCTTVMWRGSDGGVNIAGVSIHACAADLSTAITPKNAGSANR